MTATVTGSPAATTGFDLALLGHPTVLHLPDGTRRRLPVDHWRGSPDAADEFLLAACHGPTLDLGCGPGRLAAALARRGCRVLGVDRSPVAVELTRQGGAAALCRDAFARLPGEGRWHTVLLADGNIGIGGDPARLLRRVRRLLRSTGRLLVELDPPGSTGYQGPARLVWDESDGGRPGGGTDSDGTSPGGAGDTAASGGDARDGFGGWFPWAWVSVDSMPGLAAATGFRLLGADEHTGRWFAGLEPR